VVLAAELSSVHLVLEVHNNREDLVLKQAKLVQLVENGDLLEEIQITLEMVGMLAEQLVVQTTQFLEQLTHQP